jgi:hypothetical protein
MIQAKRKCYLVIYFSKENSYTVLKDEQEKLKNCKRANVKNEDNGKWEMGDIVYRGIYTYLYYLYCFTFGNFIIKLGTEEQCNKYGKNGLTQATYMPTDDEMSEFEAAPDTNNSLFKVQSMFLFKKLF